jgi:ACS family D-galactonate transporter-like MFS transporter
MQPKSSSVSSNEASLDVNRPPWAALVLMAASVSLNYVDRGTLSIAGTNIQSDLHLSNYQLGLLLSAFFWTYAICQFSYIAGWLADRLNVVWVLGCGVALWSFATGACGLAHSFTMMFIFRLALGAGECVAYPSYSRVIVNCFPAHRRGLSNGTIDASSKTGPAIGALLGGLLITRVGWRVFFIVLGVVGILWVIPWIKWRPRSPRLIAGVKAESPVSLPDLLRQPDLWWTTIALFCSNYVWYFLITWLPPYLEKERGLPKAKMAVISFTAYIIIAISSMASGWLSDFWITRGGSHTFVRKAFAGGGLTLSTVLVAVSVIDNATVAIGVLMFACAAFGMYASNTFAISQTLAGAGAAGRWTSIQNGVGNLAGVAAPWVTGWVVDRSGHFYIAFLVTAMMALASALAYVFGMGKVEPVKWSVTAKAA